MSAQWPQAKLGLIIFHFLRFTLVKPYPSSEHALPFRFSAQCKRTVTPGKTKSNQCSFLRFFSVMKPCQSSEHALLFVSEGRASAQSPQAKPSLIWFRFNEGYSNAVRKSVKVQELLWRGTHWRSFRLLLFLNCFFYMWMCVPTLCTCYILKHASAWIKEVTCLKGLSLTWKICWDVVKISYPKTVMFFLPI